MIIDYHNISQLGGIPYTQCTDPGSATPPGRCHAPARPRANGAGDGGVGAEDPGDAAEVAESVPEALQVGSRSALGGEG